MSCGGVQVVEEMETMEEELAKWVQEERKLARNLGIMTAHREMKVREAARCVGKFKSHEVPTICRAFINDECG